MKNPLLPAPPYRLMSVSIALSLACAVNSVQAQSFAWPLDVHPIGQVYADYGAVSTNKYHAGVDMGFEGTYDYTKTVKAVAAGTVHKIFGLTPGLAPSSLSATSNLRRWNSTTGNYSWDAQPVIDRNNQGYGTDNHGLGMCVIIYHPDLQVYSLYGHLDAVVAGLSPGQTVAKSDPIGKMGNSYKQYLRRGDTRDNVPPSPTGPFPVGVASWTNLVVKDSIGFRPHLHLETKDRGVLSAGRTDSPTSASEQHWGYVVGPTPGATEKTGHPNFWGYHDPKIFLNETITKLPEPIPVEVLGSVNVRDYPSTSSSLSVVITEIPSRGDNKLPAFVANRSLSDQWYQIYLPNASAEGWSASGWIAGNLSGTVYSRENSTLPQIKMTDQSARVYASAGTNSTLGYAYGQGLDDQQRFVPFESPSGWHHIYTPKKVVQSDGWILSSAALLISPSGPSITVTSPNGGERFQPGGTIGITWSSTNVSGDVRIRLSVNGMPQLPDIASSTANDGVFNWVIPSNLMAHTDYEIIIDGTTSGGFDASDAPFTVFSAPVANTAQATSISSSGATLNGKGTPNASSTQGWFEWGTSSNLSTFNSTSFAQIGAGITATDYAGVLTSLAPATKYYFRAMATNQAGKAEGNILNFTTLAPTGAAPTVATSHASGVTSDAADLAGTANPNGASTTTWFEWSTSSTLATFNSTSTGSIGSGTENLNVGAELSGLSPNTTYYFRAVASNSFGTVKGSILNFQTLPIATRVISLSGNLTFGNVPLYSSIQRNLKIANQGNSPLTINSITYPSGFSGNWAGVIAPGNTQDVAVAFAPTTVTNYSGTVIVSSDKTSGAATIAISGSGEPVRISIRNESGQIVLSWPTNNVRFALQHTTNVSLANWMPIATPPVIEGSAYVIRRAPAGEKQFFRLAYQTDLIGFYPFNGNANDESGNGHSGTVYNATLTTNRFGAANSAYQFNGSSSYIWLGDALRPNNISVCAWFKTTTSASQNLMRDRLHGWTLSVNNPEYGTPVGAAGISLHRSSSQSSYLSTSSGVFNDGNWHFIAFTYNGLNLSLYADGTLKTNISFGTYSAPYYQPGGLAIGRDGDYSGMYFNGQIDDVRIYNRALSVVEIEQLYVAP